MYKRCFLEIKINDFDGVLWMGVAQMLPIGKLSSILTSLHTVCGRVVIGSGDSQMQQQCPARFNPGW
jgi:hypothetical protein